MHRFPLLFAILLTLTFALARQSVANAQPKAEDPIDLKQCWAYSDNNQYSSIASDRSAVYVATPDAKIVAIAVDSGQKLWSAELGGEVASNLVALPSGVVVTTQTAATDSSVSKATIRILSLETGIATRSLAVNPAESFYLKYIAGQLIVVSKSGDIAVFDAITFEQKWSRKPTGAVLGEPHIGAEKLLIGTSEGQIVSIATATGEISATIKTESRPSQMFAMANGNVIYADDRGTVISLGKKWKFRLGAKVNAISEIGEDILVTSYDNFVYLLTSDGGVEWKQRLEGRIAGVISTSESNLIAFSIGGSSAVVLEPKKGRTVGRIGFAQQADSLFVDKSNSGGFYFIANGVTYSYSSTPCISKSDKP